MNLQENINRVKQIMEINEGLFDRFRSSKFFKLWKRNKNGEYELINR